MLASRTQLTCPFITGRPGSLGTSSGDGGAWAATSCAAKAAIIAPLSVQSPGLGIRNATARTLMSLRRHYNYRLYFFGQVVSISGTWMQSVAQAWFVVQNTHSPLAVGLLAVCQFGPYGLFGLFGGAFADRLDQRKVLIGTQAAFIITAALLAGLTLTGHAGVVLSVVIAVGRLAGQRQGWTGEVSLIPWLLVMAAAMLVLGWETINPILPSLLQKISVASYLRHLMPVSVGAEGIFALLTVETEPVSGWAAAAGLLVLIAIVLTYSCYRIRTLEIRYSTE